MSEHLNAAIVGDIVAHDFRTAAIFDRFGIDFCCGGGRSLRDACTSVDADPEDVLRAIEALPAAADDSEDATSTPVDQLIDHIVETHHAYVRSALPTIERYLTKLADVHGKRHPELAQVKSCFQAVADELRQHMMKEEQVLFPYVKDLASRGDTCGHMISPFGTVANPIAMMEREHREAAHDLRLIRELTNGYTPPEDGCTTYAVCMSELARFEQDLHRHVHLENNVLFPAALRLEDDICKRW
jgi:regulator of cell morphogenesis and NO signaling